MNLSKQITKLRWSLSHKLLLWADELVNKDIDLVYKMLDSGDIEFAQRRLRELRDMVGELHPLFQRLRNTVEESADDPLAADGSPTKYVVIGTYCTKDTPVRIVGDMVKYEADEVKRQIALTGNWTHLHTVKEEDLL